MASFKIATEPFLFLYCISLGVSLSLTPQLIVSKICHSIYGNQTICSKLSSGNYKLQEKLVYEKVATWNMINFAFIYIPSAFSTLFIGSLSDFISKKKILLLVPLATTLQSIIYIITANNMSSSLWLLVFGSSVTSLFADVQGAIMLAYSYMADVTAAENNRTVRMNILEGMIFLSLGFGSYSVGKLLTTYGFVIAFSLGLSASAANFIYVAFLLPDNISHNKQENSMDDPSTSSKTSISDMIKHLSNNVKMACSSINKFAIKYIFSWEKKAVWIMLLAAFFTNTAILGENVIAIVFLKHRPLALSPDQIGTFLLLLQLIRGTGVMVVAVITVKFFKPSDPWLIIVGQISVISIFTAVGFSSNLTTLMGVTPLAIGFSLAMSGLRSALTKLVLPEEHGTVLSFVAFASLIGITIMTFSANKVFQATSMYFAGACIVMLAAVCLVGVFFTIVAFYYSAGDKLAESLHKKDHDAIEEHVALLDSNDTQQDN
eukprot:gene15213-16784_t